MTYHSFLEQRRQLGELHGFAATNLPTFLYDFQSSLIEWSLRKGKAAIFADCGLGKTPIQLVWAQQIVERTNRSVLIATPLSVSQQTLAEAYKFGVQAIRSRDGVMPSMAQVVITNYERLHLFDPSAVVGLVCDESSILKHFDGATKAVVTEFYRQLPYRLLCTATAAPNDHIELGTSAEALGEMGYIDMLGRFFVNDESSIAPMSYASKWRLKPHAVKPFWRWVCSWARAVRAPSDLGFENGAFVLPELRTHVHVIEASRPIGDRLFILPAQTLEEQREERRATIVERCETVARLADHRESFVAWCHLNAEADLLERVIPGSRQVSGAHSDEEKEELFAAFASGQLRALVTKPKIGAFGLNWQHCAHMSVFPSHSYEQYYQAVRRCWRFGQTKPVVVDVISTAGESDVLGNLQRKSDAAEAMFSLLVQHMREGLKITRSRIHPIAAPDLPQWIGALACKA